MISVIIVDYKTAERCVKYDMAVRLLVEQVISKMENLPDEQFKNLELDLYRPDAPEEEKA